MYNTNDRFYVHSRSNCDAAVRRRPGEANASWKDVFVAPFFEGRESYDNHALYRARCRELRGCLPFPVSAAVFDDVRARP
jgi:hypothetical protein